MKQTTEKTDENPQPPLADAIGSGLMIELLDRRSAMQRIYPPVIDPETMAKRITVEAFWPDGSSQKHVIELYPCRRGRRDQYKAAKDGKPWRDKISLTRLCVELRKTI